jgi:hypothetical protein
MTHPTLLVLAFVDLIAAAWLLTVISYATNRRIEAFVRNPGSAEFVGPAAAILGVLALAGVAFVMLVRAAFA